VPFDVAAATQLLRQWEHKWAERKATLQEQSPGTNLNSRAQIGALLEAGGWVPKKRTPKTNQPVIDDDVLETISELYPEFAGIAELDLLRRRIAQLATGNQALLKHVGADGNIHGGLIHIGTPHSRAKHLTPNLAQVPNAKKGGAYSTESRALFRHSGDWVMVACDQANLQDRAFGHHLAEYDNGAYARAFLANEDMHWRNAIALGLIPAGTVRDKESKLHTAVREGAKTFRYGFLFGAGVGRCTEILADMVRAIRNIEPAYTAPANGKRARDRFTAATPGLQSLRNKLEKRVTLDKWLPGLDGRRIPTRSQYTALNYALASIEAIICKRWLAQSYNELRERFRYGPDGDAYICLWVHDEIVVCCRPEIAEQVGEILVRNAKEAGEHYGLKVPLDAACTIGRSWAGESLDGTQETAAAPAGVREARIHAPCRDDDTIVELIGEVDDRHGDACEGDAPAGHDEHGEACEGDAEPFDDGTGDLWPEQVPADLGAAASRRRAEYREDRHGDGSDGDEHGEPFSGTPLEAAEEACGAGAEPFSGMPPEAAEETAHAANSAEPTQAAAPGDAAPESCVTAPAGNSIHNGKIRCPFPDHDDPTPSLHIYNDEDDPHYHCFGCGAHGPLSDLPADCWAAASSAFTQADDDAATLAHAHRLWEEAKPIAGTLAARYLAEVRRIDVNALSPDINATLRFHPRCPFNGGRHPCLLALFRDVETDEPAGIHRIALTPEAQKIERHMLGRWARPRAIKLWSDLTTNEAARKWLYVGEGIETTLAAATRIQHQGVRMRPAWAAGSSGNISKLPLVAGIERLVILVDHDSNGTAQKKAFECIERWNVAGRTVALLTPYRLDSDFNDLIER
jgi:hypothetical protein